MTQLYTGNQTQLVHILAEVTLIMQPELQSYMNTPIIHQYTYTILSQHF